MSVKRISLALVLAAATALASHFSGSAGAAPIQSFSAVGAEAPNWTPLYGGGPPYQVNIDGTIVPAPAPPPVQVPPGVNIPVWDVVHFPHGARTAPQWMTFTPLKAAGGGPAWSWQNVACNPVGPPDNDCAANQATGSVTIRADLWCNGVADVLAAVPSPTGLWPNQANWTWYTLARTAAAPGHGGGGPPGGASPNAYVPQVVPFGPAFAFQMLETTTLDNAYINGMVACVP
jgi:hypothetical protein